MLISLLWVASYPKLASLFFSICVETAAYACRAVSCSYYIFLAIRDRLLTRTIYLSHRFFHGQEFVRNPRGVQLFTCGWLPVSASPKALVFLCHGAWLVLVPNKEKKRQPSFVSIPSYMLLL
jgi:hypothetical protein